MSRYTISNPDTCCCRLAFPERFHTPKCAISGLCSHHNTAINAASQRLFRQLVRNCTCAGGQQQAKHCMFALPSRMPASLTTTIQCFAVQNAEMLCRQSLKLAAGRLAQAGASKASAACALQVLVHTHSMCSQQDLQNVLPGLQLLQQDSQVTLRPHHVPLPDHYASLYTHSCQNCAMALQ